jgi:plastocyanin
MIRHSEQTETFGDGLETGDRAEWDTIPHYAPIPPTYHLKEVLMSRIRRAFSPVVVLAFCAGLYGCTSLPETTRTAAVHEIKLQEKLTPDNILVQPGDEVRWTNTRKLTAKLEIPQLKSEDLSCQRGFTNWMGMLGETARLKSNETASICFKKAAVVNYNVRAETSLGGGDQVLPGVIRVGNPPAQ